MSIHKSNCTKKKDTPAGVSSVAQWGERVHNKT